MGRGTTIRLMVGSPASGLDFEVRHLWNGGWAARDQGALRRHVEEMERLGVAGPAPPPHFFPPAQTVAAPPGLLGAPRRANSGEGAQALRLRHRRRLRSGAS